MRLRLVVALLLAGVGCGNSKSPWARKMPKAERVAWPTKCGIPAERVTALDGQGGAYANTLYSGQLEESSSPFVSCSLSWNHDRDQPVYLRVHVSRIDGVVSAADIDPLLALAMAELRPAQQDVARRLADGDRSRASSGGLDFDGGFGYERWSWTMVVEVK